jgi:cell division protein FtsA
MLNGGIILTGGGSQLKHLIQLTEYTTGLNARIGLPNEHLAPNHIEELKKPMYATCIGLILKGYSDYDHKYKEFTEKFRKVEVPRNLTVPTATVAAEMPAAPQSVDVAARKHKFWDKFKNNLIDLFKEEEDQMIK